MSKVSTQGVTSVCTVGGYSNIAIGTCGSVGIPGSVGTCGSTGIGGPVGSKGISGKAGPAGFQITDWKDDLMKKYNNRFFIKTEYDVMTFAPTNIIIDTNTNKDYKFKPSNMSDMANETDHFIQGLIILIRDNKINNILE